LAVTEPRRLALHAAARAALGEEEGDTLMALTPPANTDIATMQALERVEERLGARIDTVEERLSARIDTVEERLGARIDAVEERLGARIDRSEERSRTHTRKVVVGTGVGLYLATVTTVLGGFALLS
jgi:molybdopterin converting factor small subunit